LRTTPARSAQAAPVIHQNDRLGRSSPVTTRATSRCTLTLPGPSASPRPTALFLYRRAATTNGCKLIKGGPGGRRLRSAPLTSAAHVALPDPPPIASPSFLLCRASGYTSGSRGGAGLGCRPQSRAFCIRGNVRSSLEVFAPLWQLGHQSSSKVCSTRKVELCPSAGTSVSNV
jgi:hypothetical protein